MQQQATNNGGRLVGGERLLEEIFEKKDRPSPRWLVYQRKARVIPYLKIGRLVRYDIGQVRAALAALTVNPRKG